MKTIFPITKENESMTTDQLKSETAYIDGNGSFCIKLDGARCLELFSANGVFLGIEYEPSSFSEEFKVVKVIDMRERNSHNDCKRFKIVESEEN